MPLAYSMPLPLSGTPSSRLNFSLIVVETHWPTLVGTLAAASAGAGRAEASAAAASAAAKSGFIVMFPMLLPPAGPCPTYGARF
jgi:hypothetical protein